MCSNFTSWFNKFVYTFAMYTFVAKKYYLDVLFNPALLEKETIINIYVMI